MEKSGIVYGYITDYLRDVRREREGALADREREWRLEKLPIAEPEVADLLEILCMTAKPGRILEIGTCVGFSALLMAKACKASIITVERNPAMTGPAADNFSAFEEGKRISLLEGDAANILPELEPYFDLIFLDAAKGQYPAYYPQIKRLLAPGGLLVCDNVLFGGYVAKGAPDRHRNKTIVVRLDEFLHTLEADPDMKTVLLPISDGTSVSFRLPARDLQTP